MNVRKKIARLMYYFDYYVALLLYSVLTLDAEECYDTRVKKGFTIWELAWLPIVALVMVLLLPLIVIACLCLVFMRKRWL